MLQRLSWGSVALSIALATAPASQIPARKGMLPTGAVPWSTPSHVHVVATLHVPGTAVATSASAVWVASGLAGLDRIDPRTDRVRHIRWLGDVLSVAIAHHAVWIIVGHGDMLFPHNAVARLDPASGRILATIPLTLTLPIFASSTRKAATHTIRIGPAESVAATDTAVWVTSGPIGSQETQYVYHIDPRANRVIAVATVPAGGAGVGHIVATPNGSWVLTASPHRGGILSYIDGRANRVRTVRLPHATLATSSLAYGSGSLWVGDTVTDRVLQVDPRSGRVVARSPVLQGHPAVLAVVSGDVWIATHEGKLYTLAVVAHRLLGWPIGLAIHPFSAAATNASLWIVGREGLLQIGPL